MERIYHKALCIILYLGKFVLLVVANTTPFITFPKYFPVQCLSRWKCNWRIPFNATFTELLSRNGNGKFVALIIIYANVVKISFWAPGRAAWCGIWRMNANKYFLPQISLRERLVPLTSLQQQRQTSLSPASAPLHGVQASGVRSLFCAWCLWHCREADGRTVSEMHFRGFHFVCSNNICTKAWLYDLLYVNKWSATVIKSAFTQFQIF